MHRLSKKKQSELTSKKQNMLPPLHGKMPDRITHSSVMSNNVQSSREGNYRRRAAAPKTAARPAPAPATTDEAPPVKAGPSGPVGLTSVG